MLVLLEHLRFQIVLTLNPDCRTQLLSNVINLNESDDFIHVKGGYHRLPLPEKNDLVAIPNGSGLRFDHQYAGFCDQSVGFHIIMV